MADSQIVFQVQRKLEEAEQALSLQQYTAGAQLAQQQQQQDLTPRPTMADWAPSEELAATCTVSTHVFCGNVPYGMVDPTPLHASVVLL